MSNPEQDHQGPQTNKGRRRFLEIAAAAVVGAVVTADCAKKGPVTTAIGTGVGAGNRYVGDAINAKVQEAGEALIPQPVKDVKKALDEAPEIVNLRAELTRRDAEMLAKSTEWEIQKGVYEATIFARDRTIEAQNTLVSNMLGFDQRMNDVKQFVDNASGEVGKTMLGLENALDDLRTTVESNLNPIVFGKNIVGGLIGNVKTIQTAIENFPIIPGLPFKIKTLTQAMEQVQYVPVIGGPLREVGNMVDGFIKSGIPGLSEVEAYVRGSVTSITSVADRIQPMVENKTGNEANGKAQKSYGLPGAKHDLGIVRGLFDIQKDVIGTTLDAFNKIQKDRRTNDQRIEMEAKLNPEGLRHPEKFLGDPTEIVEPLAKIELSEYV